MANPRKFSEKIALHNQKQAEETAAFEAILKEVNCATKPPSYPKQHLPIAQNLGAYRGGSLPNVNQIGSNQGIDLQTALQHLEDMKTGRPNLPDRFHRERQRQTTCHRRGVTIMDKRAESSPYGSTYLSPPPDTSWRRNYPYLNGATLSRTNSDSALHTSAMVLPNNQDFGPNTPPTHRRIAEMVENSVADMQKGGYWDPKKLAQSRPKSCEVPNINIYPSQDQDSGIHIPISNNTGSLPDLTVLHFPSPLVTPLDVDGDQHYGNHGNSPTSLSPTSPQYNNMSGQINHNTTPSPGPRRRPAQGVPSPLVLNNGNHMSMPLSPPAGSVDPSKITSDPRRQQYMNMNMFHHRHRTPGSQTIHPRHHTPLRILHNHHRSQHSHTTSTLSTTPPNVPRVQITGCDQDQTQPSMTQYRNSVGDGGCQSPTSPLSQPSYSPAQSPGLPPVSSANNSPFAEAYYIQQQQQTNALQHQFEHFNMSHDNPTSTMVSSSTSSLANSMANQSINTSLAYTPACSQNLIGSSADFHQRYFQQLESSMCPSTLLTTSSHSSQSQSQSHQNISQPSQSNQIPDIVLTGADDILGRPNHDFAKEIGNAIIGMTDGFDTDFFSTDEAFKAGLDPLDLDGLQMLTDPSMVTDPATEDTFKLDRL